VTLPPMGPTKAEQWSRASSLASDLACAGKFEECMRILNIQIGAVNFVPMKSNFLRLYQTASAQMVGLGFLPPLTIYLERASREEPDPNVVYPQLAITLQAQIERLSAAYKSMTNGQFKEAKELFESILQALPLVVAQSTPEATEIVEFIGICREYLLGIAIELKRQELASVSPDSKRVLELAAYFTHCDLQPKHTQLSLKSAMNSAAKVKNYATADEFARRLVDLNPPEAVLTHSKKVLRLCEQKGRTDTIQLAYDPRNPFVICGYTLVPLYQGSSTVTCPYCSTSYKPEFTAKLCAICNISEIGKSVEGIQSMERRRKPR